MSAPATKRKMERRHAGTPSLRDGDARQTAVCQLQSERSAEVARSPGKVAADHYPQAFEKNEKSVAPPVGAPLLFQTATANRYHTDTAQELHDRFADYLDGICAAICQAWAPGRARRRFPGGGERGGRVGRTGCRPP